MKKHVTDCKKSIVDKPILFTTTPCSRINAYFHYPWCGLFFTCAGNIYTVFYKIFNLFFLCYAAEWSDHFPPIYLKSLSKTKSKPVFAETRDFSRFNLERFRNNLNKLNWNFLYKEPNAQLSKNNFSDLFFGLYDSHFPVIRSKFNRDFHSLEKWTSSGFLFPVLKRFVFAVLASLILH